MIQFSLKQGCKLRAIARSLQRSPSTISRELKINDWRNPDTRTRHPERPSVAGGYRAPAAHQRAYAPARVARCPGRLITNGRLWPHVEHLLRTRHSPEQIAGILRRMNPNDPALQVSQEPIYTALYAMPRGELRSELIACLRQGRKSRRPRSRGEDRWSTIHDMTCIHLRPPEIDERVIPGHWEGDLIKGTRNAAAVGTLVERTTLFVTLAKVKNANAEAAVEGFATVLNRIDVPRWLSMTYDQGRKMAQHAKLTEKAGVKVYFADPHSPWQRGINENTNGLLRQYLPKGTDLSSFTQQLDDIAWQLNTSPRKSLGFKCPSNSLCQSQSTYFSITKESSHFDLETVPSY